MEIVSHHTADLIIAEIRSDGIVITSALDGLDLLSTVYYQGFDKVILHANLITPAFFDLSTGMAGEILQKFSNFRVRLAIVGDFSGYESKSLKDFIFESNTRGHVSFVETLKDAITLLFYN